MRERTVQQLRVAWQTVSTALLFDTRCRNTRSASPVSENRNEYSRRLTNDSSELKEFQDGSA